jgi:two-component system chemotaxis response regulator CheB
MKTNKISALIVDDSKLVRDILTDIINSDDELCVVGAAADPFEAVKIIQESVPDVITLDIEMPKMDGITFLKKIMHQHPIPVIVLSAHTAGNKQLALKAFENGAMYVMHKPDVEDEKSFLEYSARLCELIKMAGSQTDFKKGNLKIQPKMDADSDQQNLRMYREFIQRKPEIIAIGASAGGTIAIQTILTSIKGTPPPIVITQHMPIGFTDEFAKRLNSLSSLTVIESKGNETLEPGKVYIAPGDKHLGIIRKGIKLVTVLVDGEAINHHKPSVDFLFKSIAKHSGSNSLAFLLTGMGKDGAQGLLEIKKHGGVTITQDKKSSVVYGMPGEANRLGANLTEIPLHLIGPLISNSLI